MNIPRARAVAIFAVLLVLCGCGISQPPISEEERCTRFGGIWRPEGCRTPGSGGGSM